MALPLTCRLWHDRGQSCPKSTTNPARFGTAVVPQAHCNAQAYSLLQVKLMKASGPICEHCGELYQGRAYRITSEEDGIVLLDMIVCHSCSIEARRLGLDTRKHEIRHIASN